MSTVIIVFFREGGCWWVGLETFPILPCKACQVVCNQTFCAGSTNTETNEKWDSSHPTPYHECANNANEADKQVTSNEKEIKYIIIKNGRLDDHLHCQIFPQLKRWNWGGSVYNRIMLIYTVNCQPAKTVSFFYYFYVGIFNHYSLSFLFLWLFVLLLPCYI